MRWGYILCPPGYIESKARSRVLRFWFKKSLFSAIFVVLVALQLYSSSYRRHPLAPLPYFVYQLTLAFFFRTHQIYWCWLLASGIFLKVCVPCTSTLPPGRWLLLYNYSATALENENDSRSTQALITLTARHAGLKLRNQGLACCRSPS